MTWEDVWASERRTGESRLKEHDGEFILDFSRNAVRGQLPNGNLAPLQLNNVNLFNGLLGLANGGTGADLSNTGPGVPVQLGSGASFTVGLMPFAFLDFSAAGGSANNVLVADGAGGASFTVIDLTNSNWANGAVLASQGGTGINNGTRTLTLTGNAGTLAFASAGLALTIPATGTAALLGTAQAFSETNSFAKLLRAHTTSGTTGYGLRIWDGTNDFGTLQSLDLGGISYLFFGNNRYYDGSGWQQFNTRVGSSFQIAGDKFDFYTFPTSSSVPTSRFGISNVGDVTFTGFMQMIEVTAPAAGAANTGRLYLEDNGAGKTRLMIRFNTGAAQQIAIQP